MASTCTARKDILIALSESLEGKQRYPWTPAMTQRTRLDSGEAMISRGQWHCGLPMEPGTPRFDVRRHRYLRRDVERVACVLYCLGIPGMSLDH